MMKKFNSALKRILTSTSNKLSELADSIETEEIENVNCAATVQQQGPSIEDVALHMSQDPRVEDEKKYAEEREKEDSQEKNKERKRLLYIIPVVILIVLLISTVPSFIKSRKAYNEATQLLASGQYDEAKNAFELLGDYSDSREQAELNVSYIRASDLMKAAEENNDAALSIIGLKRSQLEDGQDASIILYESAANIFSSLGGYKDSVTKEITCRAIVDSYYEEKNRETYDSAKEFLEEKKYLKARGAFLALGEFDNSSEMASQCLYDRAFALLEYAKNNNVRNIYLKLSDSSDQNSIISMPGAALISLGSDSVLNLKNLCGDGGADLQYEDTAPDGFLPICEAIRNEFNMLGGYRDSSELAIEAEKAGDFTREFFTLCESGQLQAAAIWLDTYDDEFENRESYPSLLASFAPYCRFWELHSGDPTLIPLTAGIEGDSMMIKTLVSISERSIVLKVYTLDNREICSMNYLPDSKGFTFSADELTLYYAIISNQNLFSYSKYYNGMSIGAVEYSPMG